VSWGSVIYSSTSVTTLLSPLLSHLVCAGYEESPVSEHRLQAIVELRVNFDVLIDCC